MSQLYLNYHLARYNFYKKKKGPLPQPKYNYSNEHPQSKTHWQILRKDDQKLVPALSKLPPSKNSSKLKYQKCMLLLFKPFKTFTDLFNGISWDESYDTANFVSPYTEYIENIQEMHVGLEEKKTKGDEDPNDNNDELIEELEEIDMDEVIEMAQKDLHDKTKSALKVIKERTGWLEENMSNQQSANPINDNLLRPDKNLMENDIKKQNEDKVNGNDDENDLESEQAIPSATMNTPDTNDNDVTLSTETCEDKDLEEIADDISEKYSLNKKQKVAFDLAIHNVIKRERGETTKQVIGYIGGPGGTGKSQVIKAIVAFHEEIKAKRKLKLTAYTGTAAKHIGGSTTHALFGINGGGKKKLERTFENVNTIIVDEVSMIGCATLAKISQQLAMAKHINCEPFGGIDILFFGDFIQFTPIKDASLYDAWSKLPVFSPKTKYEENKLKGMELWRQVNQIVFLDEQMRVTDQRYQDLLNRMREGKCTNSDIQLINGRVIGNFSECMDSFSNNRIITPGNELVLEINKLFASYYAQNQNVLVTTAKDRIGNSKLPADLEKMVKNLPATATQGLPGELPLYVGMPIFLTKNIAVELGLTNGTTGIIRSIHLQNGEKVNDVGFHHVQFKDSDCIVAELDDITVKPLHGLDQNHIPIFPRKESFSVKVKGKKDNQKKTKKGKKKGLSVKRNHFPIVPRFACTAHKSQGMTLDKAIVDLVPQPNRKGGIDVSFAYVPLSRVRRLEDLTILRPFDESVLKVKPNPACKAMLQHFKAMDKCKDM